MLLLLFSLQLLSPSQNVGIVIFLYLDDVQILSKAYDSSAKIGDFVNKVKYFCRKCGNKIYYSIADFSDCQFELLPPESVLFLKVFELVLHLIQFPEVPGWSGLVSKNRPAVVKKLIELGNAELKLSVPSRGYVDISQEGIVSFDLGEFEEEFCFSLIGSYASFSLFVH